MSRKKHSQNRQLKILTIVIVAILFISSVYILLIVSRPLKAINAVILPSPITTNGNLKVNWPNSKQAAIGVQGFGSLLTNGVQSKTPTASIAKIVTALAVLEKYPLKLGEQGPVITLSDKDVIDYNNYVTEGGSVVKVTTGETISEYQMLQAMLLPSANNMADTLAIWAYGTKTNYNIHAIQLVKILGMNSTVITDPSGYLPSTVSTSEDLVKLGEAALNNLVIAQIVSQPSATLPVAGQVNNVDYFVGQHNLIGVKTGNTDQAGGCFLSAARYDLGGANSITVIGTVMNASTLQVALAETIPMLDSVKSQIQLKNIPRHTNVSYYLTPWGQKTFAVTSSNIESPYLPEMPVSYLNKTNPVQPGTIANTKVGDVVFGVGKDINKTNIILSSKINPPTLMWKVFHPQYIF